MRMIKQEGTVGMIVKAAVRLISVLVLAHVIPVPGAFGQETPAGERTSAPRVYVESAALDAGEILKDIAFVSPVKTPEEADVEVHITSEASASGTDYTLAFKGLRDFDGAGQVLKYSAGKTDTPDETRSGLTQTLKMGLMRYVARTAAGSRVRISLQEKVNPTSVIDKWNFWVFSASVDGFYQGETSFKSRMTFGSLSANRVTPGMKIRMSLGASHLGDEYVYEGDTIKSASDSRSFEGLFVKSLDDHWSAGAYISVDSSTFQNIRSKIDAAPAIEYNLFPYSESTKRQLRFLYRVGFSLARYREETIYDKTRQNLLQEHLEVVLEFKKKWGTISTSFEASNYLHDFRKNQLELNGEISVRVFKGLSFNIHGGGARIHDQIFLPKGGATLEEILLQRRQLRTNYDYFLSVGFSYSFGSIFSNVVNPRFGSGGGGVSISISN
jgi:hypothetical protein